MAGFATMALWGGWNGFACSQGRPRAPVNLSHTTQLGCRPLNPRNGAGYKATTPKNARDYTEHADNMLLFINYMKE